METVVRQLELDEDMETGTTISEHRVHCHSVIRRNGITWVAWQCRCGYDSPLIAGRLLARQAFMAHRDAATAS